jgi:hypothetical protein
MVLWAQQRANILWKMLPTIKQNNIESLETGNAKGIKALPTIE